MKSLFGGLLIVTGAVAVAVGVLAGVERLLQNPDRRQRRRPVEEKENHPAPERLVKPLSVVVAAPVPAAAIAPEHVLDTPDAPAAPVTVAKKGPDRNFSIKRTKSEVGYVYWILEGHGRYKCFVLCDSWDEAVAQAKAKMAEVDAVEETTHTLPNSQAVSMNA